MSTDTDPIPTATPLSAAEAGMRALRGWHMAAFDEGRGHDHPVEGCPDRRFVEVCSALDAARQPVVDGVLDEHPVMALLDKAKLWRDRGTITEAEYGMVCALVFVQMPEDQTPEEREATIEFGRRWLAEHPDIAARLGGSR